MCCAYERCAFRGACAGQLALHSVLQHHAPPDVVYVADMAKFTIPYEQRGPPSDDAMSVHLSIIMTSKPLGTANDWQVQPALGAALHTHERDTVAAYAVLLSVPSSPLLRAFCPPPPDKLGPVGNIFACKLCATSAIHGVVKALQVGTPLTDGCIQLRLLNHKTLAERHSKQKAPAEVDTDGKERRPVYGKAHTEPMALKDILAYADSHHVPRNFFSIKMDVWDPALVSVEKSGGQGVSMAPQPSASTCKLRTPGRVAWQKPESLNFL